jgi:hypothetical protein
LHHHFEFSDHDFELAIGFKLVDLEDLAFVLTLLQNPVTFCCVPGLAGQCYMRGAQTEVSQLSLRVKPDE